MLENKLWLYNEIPDNKVETIAKKAGISALMAKVFLSRGITDTDYIKDFLNPDLKRLHDPFLMKDMDKAVERVQKALENKEKILVYGDYDVDGTTSTSILCDFLKRLDADVDYYIPDRQEGYGLSLDAVDKIASKGISLIISVDCGISAIDEVKYINDKGMEIIVTDHHQCKELLPAAFAVINPNRPDCGYPFKQLAGVGVTFKLITALCKALNLGDAYLDYLDIVALGTVADVVPLVNENRIIVKYGIEKMELTNNIGLKALIECAGYKDKSINSFGISFGLAPRINAAGRVGDAARAVKLFTSQDEKTANEIALELNGENKYRQDTEMQIMQQVIDIIESQIDLKNEKVIVAAGEGWHHGVIGIVASKITERYYRPCILLSCEDGVCKGSGRSIEGFNLFNALNHLSELLEKFGGHELAAGLTILKDNLPEFRKRINSYADEILTFEDLIPKLKIDVNVNKNDITMDNIRELDLLAPFGAGNPGPVFVYNGIKISDIRTVGENKHLKLKLTDGSFYTDAIGFNMGGACEDIHLSDYMDVACTLEINTWNSVDRVQFNLKGLRFNNDKYTLNSYYETLCDCISWSSDTNVLGSTDVLTGKNSSMKVLADEGEFLKVLNECYEADRKLALLINDISCLESLQGVLKSLGAGIKSPYNICYNYNNMREAAKMQIIVNPTKDKTNYNLYDTIIAYGSWIDLQYLKDIVNYIDKSGLFLYNIGVYNFDSMNIIPGRDDLAAIYQYIRSKCNKVLQIDNMHTAALEIGELYKVVMNFFKLRQGLEIFDELGLMKIKYNGINGVSIAMDSGIKFKTNLENSAKYRRLQALKG